MAGPGIVVRFNVFDGNGAQFGGSLYGTALNGVVIEGNDFLNTAEGPGVELWSSISGLVTNNVISGGLQGPGLKLSAGLDMTVSENVIVDNVAADWEGGGFTWVGPIPS